MQIEIQEAHKTPNQHDEKKSLPQYTIVKRSKVKQCRKTRKREMPNHV